MSFADEPLRTEPTGPEVRLIDNPVDLFETGRCRLCDHPTVKVAGRWWHNMVFGQYPGEYHAPVNIPTLRDAHGNEYEELLGGRSRRVTEAQRVAIARRPHDLRGCCDVVSPPHHDGGADDAHSPTEPDRQVPFGGHG